MKNLRKWILYYWFLILCLLFLPITNSFLVNLKKVVKSVINYNEYNVLLDKVIGENRNLNNKVEFYNTSSGIKSLVKERLNKVEDSELIIKFNDKRKMLE